MEKFSTNKSKRQYALELCQGLLRDLDYEKIKASTAIQRLYRIAELVGDKEVARQSQLELDGFPILGSTLKEATAILKKMIDSGDLDKNLDIDATAKANFVSLPDHRKLLLKYSYGDGFKKLSMNDPISKYEELLERIRKDFKTRYLISVDGIEYNWQAGELNKLVVGAKKWVYMTTSRIEERLEFGQIPIAAMEETFKFVDAQLFELVPNAAERLVIAYRNLTETSQENWVNVVDTCRRVIKDFADVVFPAQSEPFNDLIVTEEKYLNRIRAYVRKGIDSRRQYEHVDGVLNLLAELLAKTDNLASRSVHLGELSRFEAERIVIYTYLAIGDVLVLSGYKKRPDSTIHKRVNLNKASYDDLQSQLGLNAKVAAEIIMSRKQREFQSWDDVKNIKGIGLQTLKKIMGLASL